jgi:hypothetical protein
VIDVAVFIPNSFAASKRPCPATISPFTAATIGDTKPNVVMLSTIRWICFFECVRTLRTDGTDSDSSLSLTCGAKHAATRLSRDP